MGIRDRVMERVTTIPSMPIAANTVVGLLGNPDVEINALIRAIELDQGLTSNVLRLANSAYFAGPRSIGSLRDAIVRLGTNRIFQLVIMSAIVPVARHEIRGYDIPPGKLLEHSIAVAIGSEEFARCLRVKAPFFTFTAGLLHDLGKIVLSTFVEVDVNRIVELAYEGKMSFEMAESEVLGIDHAETGALLLQAWNLPEGIVSAVRYHHEPEAFEGDPLVVDLIHLADSLALTSGLGRGVDGLNYRASEAVLERRQFKASEAEAITCRMMEGIEEFRDLTGANTGR